MMSRCRCFCCVGVPLNGLYCTVDVMHWIGSDLCFGSYRGSSQNIIPADGALLQYLGMSVV
jgi:hypothetical protein